MRRSLLLRLLGLSLTVAVLAIAATAWLTTHATGERLRAEFTTTFEADSHLREELLTYASNHESWDGVDALLTTLSEKTGRRVGLKTLDGKLIADSAGPGAADLPDDPVAKIDAASSQNLPLGDFTAWRLTDSEEARRKELVAQWRDCVKAKDPTAEIIVGEDGGLILQNTPTKSADDASELQECLPPEPQEPSAAARELLSRFIALRADCLERNGGPADIPVPSRWPRPELSKRPHGKAAKVSPAVARCEAAAMASAIKPFVPSPALLYTGSGDRFDPFSGGGLRRTVLTGLGIVVLAAGLTLLAGRRLTRPIRALTEATNQMGGGDRAARVPVSGSDEVARLGRAFNAMADSIEAGERQRKNMVADIAHELRNPLANVRGYLEAAEDGVVPVNDELIGSLQEEAKQLHHLIDDLGLLALADAGALRMHPEETDAVELASRVVAAHQAAANSEGLTLSLEAGGPITVIADPKRLRQALNNLVSNAVRYTPSGGTVIVTVRSVDGDTIFAVTDDGPGIPAEHLPQVFERFYRVEQSRSRATGGSGLGLAITRQLVEANGGEVTAESAGGKGSTFTIRIPA